MQTTRLTLYLAMILLASSHAGAAGNAEVQAALDWQLPGNNCQPPGPLEAGQERRFKKQKKKYDKCVESYKKRLVEDFGRLRNVAQYGLTQAQADAVLDKLKLIQAVVEHPMALPPEDAIANSDGR